MPNGSNKNYVRLCGAIDGFRVRYGRWPTTARLWPGCIDSLRHALSDEGFARVEARLTLVEHPEATVMVEDEEGRSYDYGSMGFPPVKPEPSADDVIGAKPRPPSERELKLFHRQAEELLKENPDADFVFPPDS